MLKSIEEVIVTLEMNVWPQVVELQWMHIVSSLHILNILTTNTILMKKHPIKYKLLLKMNDNNRYENKRDHYFSDLCKSTNCNL